MARFTLPRDLYHGKGALEALKTTEGKRAMICVGGGLDEGFGFDKNQQYWKKRAWRSSFTASEADPSVETVMKARGRDGQFQRMDYRHGRRPRSTRRRPCGSNMNTRCTFEDMQGLRPAEAAPQSAFLRRFLHLRHGDRGDGVLHHHRLFQASNTDCRF